ncbi:reticulon-1-A isoform X4 [Agrilus planipennis]|uniref:Reticulon-like protein n=1 Tax=Agrilus planipennis TaxID=224129 RepID=A0A7F5R3E0_AGRPL|nr:reticulon-1-A isoform X4 [Agrilus planipennis]
MEEQIKSVAKEVVSEVINGVSQEIGKRDSFGKCTLGDAEGRLSVPCSLLNPYAWFRPNQLNPRVESLIYWRDPKKSGPVFAGVLIVLLALTYFSLISVVAYLSLLILTGTISFRIYKNIVQAVQKTGDGHPFKEILEAEVGLPQDKTKEVSEVIVANLNGVLHELRRLFLVEDLVDSIKFAVFLWCMTYLGAWFNGMTLVIISWVALFTLPKVYEMNKTQIDNNLQLVKSKLAEFTSKVKAAIPIGKKEEKKDQ